MGHRHGMALYSGKTVWSNAFKVALVRILRDGNIDIAND